MEMLRFQKRIVLGVTGRFSSPLPKSWFLQWVKTIICEYVVVFTNQKAHRHKKREIDRIHGMLGQMMSHGLSPR